MDSLIALGSGAALVYGIFAMYRISYGLGYGDMAVVEHYSHDLYFESSGTDPDPDHGRKISGEPFQGQDQ